MQSLSVRIPEEMAGQLEDLAKVTGRTKSFLIVEALSELLERELWQIREIKQALTEADNNDFATDEEMAAFEKKWG